MTSKKYWDIIPPKKKKTINDLPWYEHIVHKPGDIIQPETDK